MKCLPFPRFIALELHRTAAFLALFLAVFLAGSFRLYAQEAESDPVAEAVALFNQGQDLHEKGDIAAAVATYEKALKILPEFPEAEVQRGNAFVSLGKINDAEKAFRRAVELRADWSLAHASLGSLLVQKGDYRSAEPALLKAIELDKQNFPAHSSLAELKLRTNAGPEILRESLKTIAAFASGSHVPASVWASKAALEFALGDHSAAKGSLARAIAIEPKNRLALTESVRLALLQNDPQSAADLITRLESLGQTDTTRLLRARLLLAENKFDEAVKVLDAIASPGPEVAKLRESILVSSSTDEAALQKQLESDPKNAAVLLRLCSVLRTKDPRRALEFCRRASEADPSNISPAIGYAAALVQAKQYETAVNVLRRLLETAPDNSTARANLATALFQLGRFADAKAEYRWLADKQPGLAGAYYFLGITHDRLGEYLDAMANYQQFLRLADPSENKIEIEKVNLRIPVLQKQLKENKGRKNG